MSEFKEVTVTKAASVYFDGKVTSRKVTFNDGSFKTLGIMMPGEYKFGTNEEELMEITAGECEILLAGATEWQNNSGGGNFCGPSKNSFLGSRENIIFFFFYFIK